MTDHPAFTDREYHKAAPVPATPRPSIYELRQPAVDDPVGELFDRHAPLPAGGRLLDAGCGPGAYVAAARARLGPGGTLVPLDLAHGRVALIEHEPAVAGDVAALPFPDATFDAALAMHMLYHVPDIPAAVRELRRVLRAGGVLYAFTNSERAQWELIELYLRNGGGDSAAFGDSRFSNESGGALLRTGFDDVTLLELTDTWLEVTDAECIVDELQRLRYTLEPGLAPGASWDRLVDGARADAQAVIDRDGAFRMTENHGLFTCRA